MAAAVLRSLFGGWCTASRFQNTGICLFGCADAPDQLRHYMVCRQLADFGSRRLRRPWFGTPQERRAAFLGLDSATIASEQQLCAAALLVAASYRLHCTYRRRRGELQGREVIQRALEQAVREAAAGHAGAMRLLDGLWVRPQVRRGDACA